ncbi:unnamed protein product [Phytomonas sp. EM1]|nr:unnamed protein product [Phytomonas sp. EM1]|eukprot:CCW65138.1 unnamed protein product [Phytomonas sp. isolate EM1]
MHRISSLLRVKVRKPIDATKLFGAGRNRNAQQRKVYQQLKYTTLQSAFPHIAACWVGPCWGTVMQTPSNISPVCIRMAVWRCSQCLKEFEMSIAKFIDGGGICPICHRAQKNLPNAPSTGKNGDSTATPALQYAKAPRMIHSNYKSVLNDNPEWEHRNIQPMLAQRWELVENQLLSKSEEDEEQLLLASPKIDGIRCLVGYNKLKDAVQFFSRGGILLECCHGLSPQMRPLFRADPTLMLDGELFAPECNFEQLNGLVRRRLRTSTPAIHAAQRRLLEYFAFDIMYSKQLSPEAPFSTRYELLKQIIPVCGAKRISNYQHDEKRKKMIRGRLPTAGEKGKDDGEGETTAEGERVRVYHVPAARVRPAEMPDVLREACSQGFEGVMIRRPEFPYEHGKRSFGLLKYKQMHDAEFKIVGFLPGEGKFKGGLGAFVCETKDGYRFSAPPKVSTQERLALWKRQDEFRGKYLTVQYQELSSQDVPRFPIAKVVRGSADQSDWL